VTPHSEPADPIEGPTSDPGKDMNGDLKRALSPASFHHRLTRDGTDETLTEIPLDDSNEPNRRSSETTGATSTIGAPSGNLTPATSAAPDLPPRKRGSVSSASSGLSTPPVHSVAQPLPARRGPFGWLRSSSTSTKPQPPALPPRTSVASVNYAPATLPNIDLLIARLEEQSKLIEKGDEKLREEYAVGSEELRRSFERIQKEHRPTEGDDDEIDWGTLVS